MSSQQEAQRVGEVMTANPITMPRTTSLREAAQAMSQHDIGSLVVIEDRESQRVAGIVTDRDIVVRGVAQGFDPDDLSLGDVMSGELVTVTEDTPVKRAIDLMMEKAVRRLAVVRDGRAVGVVSIGDLAVDRDTQSALGQISAQSPNN